MLASREAVIKMEAVGFDDSLLRTYFPTSLQELTEHTGVQPTGEIQGESGGNSASVTSEDNPRTLLI